MRALIQRVTRASVSVDGETVGEIGPGLCIFVGVTHDDTRAIAAQLAAKVHGLRVFSDAAGVMNRSLSETRGSALVISQFTLYGDARKGRRPSWGAAARPEVAEPLIEEFVVAFRALGATVATGKFRADMQVELVNDGPVTLLLEAPSQ
jgi:D-aminoacyl-tRNA deacylase